VRDWRSVRRRHNRFNVLTSAHAFATLRDTEVTDMATRAIESDDRLDAVVVGAGFAGLYMVHRLREAGMTVRGIEAGDGVGGTWYWNRYPGARCDIPSLLYSYTFSDDLAEEWQWSEKYAPQPEILAYANHVADRFDLRRSFLFETRVTSAHYNDAEKRWTVKTDKGDTFSARHVVMATGCLSVPKQPDLPGADRFKGKSYITGLWPHEGVDFTGQRVAVIGTGSSAIQSMPIIADQASSLTVFQRTPNYSLPAKNRTLTEDEVATFRAGYPEYVAMLRKGQSFIPVFPRDFEPTQAELEAAAPALWNGDGLLSLVAFPNLVRNERVNAVAAKYVRDRIAEIVEDPALAEKLTPRDYPIGAKRACVDTDYYATFNRPNVRLVDLRETPIVEVTENGVRTREEEIAVDSIVYATGFDAMTGALARIDIRGRGGVALNDVWAEGPKTYLGLQVAGFPNFFLITGPGSPSVLSNMLNSIEAHVDWIMDAVLHLRDRQLSVMEASSDAQDAWVAHVNEEADLTLFPQANSWYIGANVEGKPRVFMPYVGENYKQHIDTVAAQGYAGFVLSAA
jgi:cyclohexanone monooxygenase